jgi:hypothetical protein
MNLQDWFYIIGIIYMTLYTVLLIVVIVLLVYAINKINEFIETLKDYLNHPKETAVKIGSKLASTLLDKAVKRQKRG